MQEGWKRGCIQTWFRKPTTQKRSKNDILDFHPIRAPQKRSTKDTYIKQRPSSFQSANKSPPTCKGVVSVCSFPSIPKLKNTRGKKTNKSRTGNNEGPSKQIVAGEGNRRVRGRAGSGVAGTLELPAAAAPLVWNLRGEGGKRRKRRYGNGNYWGAK